MVSKITIFSYPLSPKHKQALHCYYSMPNTLTSQESSTYQGNFSLKQGLMAVLVTTKEYSNNTMMARTLDRFWMEVEPMQLSSHAHDKYTMLKGLLSSNKDTNTNKITNVLSISLLMPSHRLTSMSTNLLPSISNNNSSISSSFWWGCLPNKLQHLISTTVNITIIKYMAIYMLDQQEVPTNNNNHRQYLISSGSRKLLIQALSNTLDAQFRITNNKVKNTTNNRSFSWVQSWSVVRVQGIWFFSLCQVYLICS